MRAQWAHWFLFKWKALATRDASLAASPRAGCSLYAGCRTLNHARGIAWIFVGRWGQPNAEALETLTGVVALTTVGTSAQYWIEYSQGRLMR